MQLALGDALAIALLESHGFTALDFGLLHPGGKLGALLKVVRDLMHTGAAVPLAPLGTAMSAAILELSAKGLGCVGIVDPRTTDRYTVGRMMLGADEIGDTEFDEAGAA